MPTIIAAAFRDQCVISDFPRIKQFRNFQFEFFAPSLRHQAVCQTEGVSLKRVTFFLIETIARAFPGPGSGKTRSRYPTCNGISIWKPAERPRRGDKSVRPARRRAACRR